MVIDGTYRIEIDTPMGKQKASVELKTDGCLLSGVADTPLGKKDFSGTVDGSDIAWQIEISSPLGKMKLEFTGTVSGSNISGQAKAGSFGCFPFCGARL